MFFLFNHSEQLLSGNRKSRPQVKAGTQRQGISSIERSHSSLLDLTKKTETHNLTWIGESPLVYRTDPNVVQLSKHQTAPCLQVQVLMCIRLLFFLLVRIKPLSWATRLFSPGEHGPSAPTPTPHPPHSFGAYSQYCSSHPPCISTASHSLVFSITPVVPDCSMETTPLPSFHPGSFSSHTMQIPDAVDLGRNHKSLLE